MGDILIRNVPESLKDWLVDRARASGRSLSEEAKFRLVRSLADERERASPSGNALDAIRSTFVETGTLLTDEEHTDFMRAVEDLRRDTGRPVPEFE